MKQDLRWPGRKDPDFAILMYEEKNMTDLLITGQFPPYRGGVSHYLYGLFRHIAEKRPLSVITLSNGDDCSDYSAFASVHRISQKGSRKSSLLRLFIETCSHASQNRKCTIFAGTTVPEGLIALIVKYIFPALKVVIMTYGSEIVRNDRKGYPYLRRVLLEKADAVCTISTFTGNVLKERFRIKNILLAPPAYEGGFSEHERGGIFTLLTVSALIPRKGHLYVLNALSRLKEQMKFRYIIAGNGPMEKVIRDKAEYYGIGDSVEIMTGLSNDEIRALYESADVFVMPAYRKGHDIEGFGIVYLEAGACGLPVIAADSGGVPDVVHNGKNGILVKEKDAASLAEAILQLYKDRSLCGSMGDAGRITAESFNYDSSSKMVLGFLNKLK